MTAEKVFVIVGMVISFEEVAFENVDFVADRKIVA